jgi:hypothetical protein
MTNKEKSCQIRVAKALARFIGSPYDWKNMPSEGRAVWILYARVAINAMQPLRKVKKRRSAK